MRLKAYLAENTMCGRVAVRMDITGRLVEKTNATSFPNTLDPGALAMGERARDGVENNAGPSEHIWTTLTDLLTALAGFGAYLALLSNLDGRLLAVTAATSAAGFLITTRTGSHLDLTVRAGEKLAIVGLNGAGKTTLVKLLCGLLDPTEGRVLLNGQDIREFDRRAYYGLFSAVFQDFSLLDVMVAETVAQRREGIDRRRVEECLEKAGLTAMVAALPQGLDTHVGRAVYEDGVLFSGGQTQRLMLARALYKDGPILLLDEPTAALDPIAENDIYLKYSGMTRGKTSLFISHRLASTRFCDRILYMEGGAVAEEGTHEELLAKGGAYAALFEVQSRYYREGREF